MIEDFEQIRMVINTGLCMITFIAMELGIIIALELRKQKRKKS